jgi:signal transduction histidine kinase
MPGATPTVWERVEGPVYDAIPYFVLALSALLTLANPDQTARGPTLVLSAVAAVWIYLLVTRRPALARRHPLGLVYFAGFTALAGTLVFLAPPFGMFAWVGYLHAVGILPGWWKIPGVVATAVVVATSQAGGIPHDSATASLFLVLFVVNASLAGALGAFALLDVRRSAEQKRTIEQLAEANRKLEAMMAENAGLQAQLLTQAREAGVLDERQRMAREIHDTLAQGLTGIVTQLEAARQAADDPAAWRRHLDNATTLARESLREARRSVQALRAEALDTARLPDALAEVARRWAEVHGVAAEVTTTGQPRPLHPEVEMTLLRTAQEALANVAKHAGASRVGLTLSYMEDVVALDVRDDGVGFDPVSAGAAGEGGFGLVAMRQRMRRLAGRLEVESRPGSGTAISASVPAIPAEASHPPKPVTHRSQSPSRSQSPGRSQ